MLLSTVFGYSLHISLNTGFFRCLVLFQCVFDQLLHALVGVSELITMSELVARL
jgi:hypothetical protein